MHGLIILIVPVMFAAIFLKLRAAYIVSLVCSLAAVSLMRPNMGALPLVIVFSLTPLVCWQFRFVTREGELSLEDKKVSTKAYYQQMLKERSLIEQSNMELAGETSKTLELYRMTRDMSVVLSFEDLLLILGNKFKEAFKFEKIRLIAIDEEKQPVTIEKVLGLSYNASAAEKAEIKVDDAQIIKDAIRKQTVNYIESESSISFPLRDNDKLLAVLLTEGVSTKDVLGKFSILAGQFALEFKRVRLYQKIQQLAATDGLTQVFSRRYFLERLDEEFKRSARHNLCLSFLMIDIDYFKKCNDNYGHLTGDVVLKDLAALIKASVREIDLVVRYGGEEFSVLLPDTDKAAAAHVAERNRLSIAEAVFKAYDETVRTTISIGVASFPADAKEAKPLIDKADQALYQAKEQGRNRVCLAGK